MFLVVTAHSSPDWNFWSGQGYRLNGIWSWWQFSFRFSEPNGIPIGTDRKENCHRILCVTLKYGDTINIYCHDTDTQWHTCDTFTYYTQRSQLQSSKIRLCLRFSRWFGIDRYSLWLQITRENSTLAIWFQLIHSLWFQINRKMSSYAIWFQLTFSKSY